MTRSTLLLPKGIEELIASCWVLKGKCTFFSHKTKLQIRLLLLTDTDASTTVSLCCAGGRGQLHSPPKPNLWDRIMQVIMPINQRAIVYISEERCYLSTLPFDHKSRQASQPLQPLLHCSVIHPNFLIAKNHSSTLLPSGMHRAFSHDHCSNGQSKGKV